MNRTVPDDRDAASPATPAPTHHEEHGGPPAGPTAAPNCGHRRAFRRGVCQPCYRKLGGAGLPLGPDGRVVVGMRQLAHRFARMPREYLAALVDAMPDDQVAVLAEVVAKARVA